ncbi:DNA topoisomerase I [candidate division CPR3 bacterium GWF2_35_18]|uniref:DNA topoisomerase 1 n=1 Tax=candidate division CPR3 bacterium GW2011_GWF2_35_18 TaxID=1618350 RepID=A0A0G0EQ65_UNCC3|nr:MAG: topoisomerase protein [candidate division CPR3 bacterium GW2011_GWF2_35_18]OGB62955.1 MAG: DNA topoisomerase I [candidate division CPR3 bacterium GWF2_35_18]OGB65919.1 MAG: DNA topoisomerase I [candidate division CPR3 bacterium RIFOXYA2_FULL_35_13]OGB79261.1 MAG: DNA topoisomerase I [candidate division CPR3 bacterium RIFOXYB2_FULL_35_8]
MAKPKVAVIVESPTKAKTISKYLPSNYQIEASFGHMRDLPKGNLGVDVENNFNPSYVIPRDKTKQVNQFKKQMIDKSLFYLATDPDREGEAIAFHVREILKKNNKDLHDRDFKRVVFHEITKEAIQEAFERPMMLNEKLFEAQTARRVLDRLVGYKLSPLLWDKIRKGLSAGRVQSVTVKLIVDREREIQAFKAEEYWEVEADFFTVRNDKFKAILYKRGDITKKNGKITIKNEQEAQLILKELEKGEYRVGKIEDKKVSKSPYPPFITSTLQQAAINIYSFSSKRTMMAAQKLFEKGLITYMRTDSFNLSESATSKIREYIKSNFGKDYLPESVLRYKSRSKVAQEAHEAIRPTDINLTPTNLNSDLEGDEKKVYELIWKRTLACQMEKSQYLQTSCDIITTNFDLNYLLKANGNRLLFSGWRKVYTTENGDHDINQEHLLPELKIEEKVLLDKLSPNQKFTKPPARYTEASLIKALEEHDIGRPSTYAPTISTILARLYIEKEEKSLKPTEVGFKVTDFLVQYFPDIVNYDFTAEMEESLDAVARGERKWVPLIAEFYSPFEKKIEAVFADGQKIELEEDKTTEVCEKCGKPMVIKVGRFGRFLACSGYPECKNAKPLVQKIDFKCPECGGDVVIKRTKKGRKFYGCSNYPNCKYASWKKPQEKKAEVEKTN